MPLGASSAAIWRMPASLVLNAAADGQRLRVDPDAVAALDRAWRLDAAEDWHAHAAIGFFVQAGLRTPERLAHGKDDRAVIGHQRRVVREDGIGKPVVLVGQPFDFSAGSSDEVGERLVLARGARRVEAGSIVPFGRLGMAHGACRRAHQHAPQRRRHGLRTVLPLHLDVHPASLRRSETANKHAVWAPARATEGGLTAASRPVHPATGQAFVTG